MIKNNTHTHEGTSYASGTIILMITRYCIEQQRSNPFETDAEATRWEEDTRVILRRAGMFRRRCCWNQFETSMCKSRERKKNTRKDPLTTSY